MHSGKPSVLCAGIYLADRENTARHVTGVLSRSRDVDVTMRWIALTSATGGQTDVPGTVAVVYERTAKCILLNRLLGDLGGFDYVLLCDDDIEIAEGFADALIAVARHANFALFQPARTLDSYIDHPIVAQSVGLLARQTCFVEIGPVVGMRCDAASLLLPFAPQCAMGWGLDFVWPVKMKNAGLRMGIIDAVPVAHRIRKPVSGYDGPAALNEMLQTLCLHPHLNRTEAFRVLQVLS